MALDGGVRQPSWDAVATRCTADLVAASTYNEPTSSAEEPDFELHT